MDNFNLDELEKSELTPVQKGDIITGKVIKVSKDTIYLDIGYKMEGKIDAVEFNAPPNIGDEVEVLVVSTDEVNGDIFISRKEAQFIKAWTHIQEIFDTSPYITGEITDKLENGYQVDIGLPALLPFSHIRRTDNFDELKNKQLMFKILDIKEKSRKVILSRRLYLNEVSEKKKKEIFESIEEGKVFEGIVKNIKNFGVFIDLGGIDAFIPKTELTWSKNVNPNDVVKIDQQVKGSVISFSKKEGKITLSMKNLMPNPWNTIEEKYQEGMIAKGKVVKIINSGAFIEMEPGIEGYISNENLTWTRHIKSPFDIVKVNDPVEFKILNINKINKKISLGLKQVLPNPWDEISKKYFVGQKLTIKIKHITKTGAFVQIDKDVEGFIDVDDVSWIKKYRDSYDAFKKGATVSAVITDVDIKTQLIKLSLKQLLVNPWQILKEKMDNRTPVTVTVSTITKRGSYVRMEDDLQGFIPYTHYDNEYIEDLMTYFKKNDKVTCVIVSIDDKKKLAICSAKVYKKTTADKEMEQYIKKEPIGTAKLGDFFNLKKDAK
ncbi:MAG: S1 RNA-binding domain-containing protein [Spirochaetes bacterium]|nr:S1 RNA-binding domain-containing protein [Spirochaetota bacterium]